MLTIKTMNKFKNRRLIRLTALLGVILTPLSFANSASAATKVKPTVKSSAPTTVVSSSGTATFSAYGNGYSGVMKTVNDKPIDAFAFLMHFQGAEGDTPAFCVQLFKPFNTDPYEEFLSLTFPVATGPGLQFAKAADIAAMHLTMGTPLTVPGSTSAEKKDHLENVAVQLAIWALTNPDDLDINKIDNADVLTRVKFLLTSAQADRTKITSSDVTVTSTVKTTGLEVKAVNTGSNKPIAGLPVTLLLASDKTVVGVTDSKGMVKFKKLAKGKIKLSYTTIAKAGTMLAPHSGQAVVTAEDATIHTSQNIVLKTAIK